MPASEWHNPEYSISGGHTPQPAPRGVSDGVTGEHFSMFEGSAEYRIIEPGEPFELCTFNADGTTSPLPTGTGPVEKLEPGQIVCKVPDAGEAENTCVPGGRVAD